MIDDSNLLEKAKTTFRFGSGQILTLDQNQIEKIPYLSAMISSADRFESACDEDGHYKLDPNIDYQHFFFVLRSLSFRSARGLFVRLSEEENVIPIVALLDFLGLLPQPAPTLKEVDSTFFSSVVYSTHCEEFLRIVKPSIMRDMAVHFTIALIKEEYDFGQCEVMDQIYWFVMFILSATMWFGPRLRHHLYITAKNCFAVFKPSFLKSLEELTRRSEKESSRYFSVLSDGRFRRHNKYTYSYLLSNMTFSNEPYEHFNIVWLFFLSPSRQSRRFIYSIYEGEDWFSYTKESLLRDPLEVIYRCVLEIMYTRLQGEICESARAELRQQKKSFKCVSKQIDDIFKAERAQEEIDSLILQQGICSLTRTLEHEHAKLVQSISEYYPPLEFTRQLFAIWGNEPYETEGEKK